MFQKVLAAFALGLLVATPALAEDCLQTLKDATAQLKANSIGPMSTAAASDLVARAEPLCNGDVTERAQGIELLRDARALIGE